MAKFFRVQTGDRPDLAAIGALSQLDVKGYAFPKIFPIFTVGEKAGQISVAPAGLTESKGSKGRSNGNTLSPSDITPVDVSWSVTRYEGRGRLFEDDGAAYASAEAADKAGAEQSQRLAWNYVESDAFAKVFTATRKSGATELSDHAVVKTLQKKAKSLRKYGRPALVMTINTWYDFVEIPEVRYRLEKFAGAGNDIGFLATDTDKVLTAVSTLLSFDQIILFDGDIVDADGTYDGCIAVMGLRRIEAGDVLNAIKSRATYGWCPVYLPDTADGEHPFDMRTWYDDENKASIYDSEAFIGIVEALSSAVAMTKLAASYTEYGVPEVTVTTGT